MSKVDLHLRPDGSAVMVGPFGPIEVDDFECDLCGALEDFNHQYEHLARGATGRVCAVMWLCRNCGPEDGATLHTEECTHE